MMRASIYEHAERLFAERGYAGTTPHDIADAVGISRQSLYYYVNGKHEILATLVSEMTTNLNAEMKSLIADMESAAEALQLLVELTVKDRARNADRFKLLDRSESALPEDLASAYLDGRRQALALLVSVIESGVRQGRFSTEDARISALTVFGMTNWVAWWFKDNEVESLDLIAGQIARAAIKTVAAPVTTTDVEPPDDASAMLDAISHQLDRLRVVVNNNAS